MIFKKKRNSKCTVFVNAKNEKNDFTLSVDSLTPKEIPLRRSSIARRSVSAMALSAMRYFVLTLSSLVFVASCSVLVIFAIDNAKSHRENEFYQNLFYGDSDLVSVDMSSYENVNTLTLDRTLGGEKIDVDYDINVNHNSEFEKMRTKLLGLKRMNPDVWGWISVPGTPIEHPIMFSGDNEYYLDKTPAKEYSKNGSIFADGRTEARLEDNRNLIIYGHNIAESGASPKDKFAYLVDFTREDLFMNGKVIISTLDGIYTYEMFSIYPTVSSYNYIRTYFPSDQSFLAFADTCEKKSMYHTSPDFSSDDKMLTLSTCTNMRDNKRWAIHCKLVAISK